MAPPIKILLISKATEQALKLRESLANVPGFSLKFEETAESAMAILTKDALKCVIFNFVTFGIIQVRLIQGICNVTKIPQVLVFADTADTGVVEAIKDDQNLIFIEKPLMNFEKDVVGLCERLITGNAPVFQREGTRHSADQVASIMLIETGRHYDARVRNMNDKGACLEINTSLVKVNDKIKVTVALEKLNRQRVMMAEVRWVKPYPGKSVMGIRFSKA